MRPRSLPNILLTGTPGCGKTVTSAMLAQATGLVHIELGKLVKEKGLHDGFDEEFNSYLINDDKVCDELEEAMQEGGKIVDHHGCEIFPERWFDLVVVLRANNEVLYPRLEGRGYNQKKITENIECEIMDVVKMEAYDSYDAAIIVELRSETAEDMEENVQRIETWIENWKEDNAASSDNDE
ncbi:AAA domain-containing protein [Obelidium mucronatum]|nr:AAA domain-containing protein [Obelidium mucronatum]